MPIPLKERGKALCVQKEVSFQTKEDLEQLDDLARSANLQSVNELFFVPSIQWSLRQFLGIVVVYFYEFMFMNMGGLYICAYI